MSKEITQFKAYLPDIQSAINVSGTGYTRIKLDIPEIYLPQVMSLMASAREKVFVVKIEEDENR